MLASLTLCCLLIGQEPLDKRISFSHPPARLETLLPQLSKAAGAQLKFDSTTVNEVVTVRFEAVPVREVMAKLADVCSAQWEIKDGHHTITRPPALAAKQAAQEHALYVKEVARQLQFVSGKGPLRAPLTRSSALAYAIEVEKTDNFDPSVNDGYEVQRQAERNINRQMPINVAQARICRALDPAMVAMLPEGRTTFSTRPTRMQRPMPASLHPIIRDFFQDQKLLSSALNHVPDRHLLEFSFEHGIGAIRAALPQDAKALVYTKVEKGIGHVYRLEVEIVIADAQRRILNRSSGDTSWESDENPVLRKEIEPKEKGMLPVSQDTRTYLRLKAATPEQQSELLRKLIHPEAHDPMALNTLGLLPAYAQAKGLNMAARLPDDDNFFGISSKLTDSGVPAAHVAQELADPDLVAREAGGWLLVKPSAPRAVREFQIDRAVLGPALRRLAKQHTFTFAEAAEIYASLSDWVRPPWFNDIDRILEPVLYRINKNPLSEALPIYATLSAAQRQALWSGDGLSVSALNAKQRALVEDLVFRQTTVLVEKGDGSHTGEPSEWLPDGLSSAAVLKGAFKTEPFYLVSQPPDGPRVMDPFDVASLIANWGAQPETKRPTSFLALKHYSGHFVVQHPGNMVTRVFSLYNEAEPGSQPSAYEGLPAARKKELDAQIAEVKKLRQKAGTPPPREGS